LSKYTFQEGSYDSRFKIIFERNLFNESRHRFSQSEENWQTFSLINEQAEQVVAQIHFYVAGSIASSPYKAPFGSIEFSEMEPETLFLFFTEVEQKLRSMGVKKVKIKDIAQQFRPKQFAILHAILHSLDFSAHAVEINSAIAIDDSEFKKKISGWEATHLRQSKREQFGFRIIPMEKLNQVYSFIQMCREEREMMLSMTLAQLKCTMQKCPNDFLLFGIFKKDELIAASISVIVNERILYDFYHSHSKSYDRFSPVVALIKGMYTFSQQHNFAWLDLGTSTLDGKVNFSLLNFKTELGGQLSVKLTFEKDLA